MGSEKRGRVDDGDVNYKSAKLIGDDGEKTVTVTLDDEVDEFFAILRRVRVAVKYFKEGGDLTESRRRSLSLQTEDLGGANGVTRREEVDDNLIFDLNVDPNVDQMVFESS